jgi:predicted nucleic acid-binding protein
MPVAQFLVDVSAWVRYPEPAVGARLDELGAAGQLATSGLTELQLLAGLEDSGTYNAIAKITRQAYPRLDMSEADVQRALDVQRLLVEQGVLRVPLAALLVAAIAERHRVAVLHANAHVDLVARATGQPAERVAMCE